MSDKGARLNLDELVDECRGRIELLEASLPLQMDAFITPSSKLPTFAVLHREALMWRMVGLSRGGLYSLDDKKLIQSILLTRAAMETVGALWHLRLQLERAVGSNSLEGIFDYLKRATGGSRSDPQMPEAIQVLKFIDCIDREVKGFRWAYNELCEFAHPNWAGTTFHYTHVDSNTLDARFGSNVRGVEYTARSIALNLQTSLGLFEIGYQRLGELFYRFVELCEQTDEHQSEKAGKVNIEY